MAGKVEDEWRFSSGKRRLRKLVGDRKVKPELEAISEKNQGNSRLLNLPPEIRNRIWNNVFGCKTVHMGHRSYRTGRYTQTICTRDISDAEEVGKFKSGSEVTTLYQARHHDCIDINFRPKHDLDAVTYAAKASPSSERTEIRSLLGLHALRTCRQIYDEAALLAFSENTFSFQHVEDLGAFTACLIPVQAKALERVVIGAAYNQYSMSRLSRKGLMKTLGGSLSQLTLFIPATLGWYGQSSPYVYVDDMVKAWAKHNEMPIRSVKALIEIQQTPEASVVSQQTVRQWEKSIEEGIVSGSVTRRSSRIAKATRAA